MSNYILKTFAGDSFNKVALKAKEIAAAEYKRVEFTFNGKKCIVSKFTNLKFLERDFSNSFIMDWEKIGPNCVKEYSKNIQEELNKRIAEKEEKAALAHKERIKKENVKKHNLNSKIKEITLELKDENIWKETREKNKDPYGKAAVDYAEYWGKLMQIELSKDKKLSEIASKTSQEADIMGITGFMYGCAVSILSNCWIHGEDLRKWHNKNYGHKEEGVVNPAIITLKSE